MFPRQSQGRRRGRRRQHGVAQRGEHGGGHLQDQGLVLDQEDGLSAARHRLRRSSHGARREAAVVSGQVDAEHRPPVRPAVDLDAAAVQADDAVDRGQPQTGALAQLLGGEERFEQVGEGVVVHAAAGVAHRQAHVAARRDLRVTEAVGLVEGDRGGLDGDPAGVADGVAGVDTQVDEDLVDLGRIDAHRRQPPGRQPGEVDVLADEPPDHLEHAGHGRVQVEHPRRRGLPAGKGKQLLGEVGGALHRLADGLQPAGERR